ncbi:MAG: site-specific DNA-methyltransferase [Pseudomonadota bacterium]
MIQLMQGDCLERMKEIESGSVDMILTDPPYGTVKGMVLKGQTKETTQWDETIDHELMLSECNRILRTNGALVLFSQDPYTAKLMIDTHGNLPFSYRLTWVKDHFASPLSAKKAPVNYTEDICVFFKKYDTLGQHPLRDYCKSIFDHIGKTKKQLFSEMGHQGVCHFMRYETMQFTVCTEKTYNELIACYGIDGIDGFISYSEMYDIDRRFARRFARRFNLPDGQKFKSNVLEYKKDYTGLHPTQKPVALMEDLIKTYTNEGDTVLDFTMGSGTTGVAAKNLNRGFIGIELDQGYFEIAKERINNA